MGFDVASARKEGYSDAEIAQHLAESAGIDISQARENGYSDLDVIQELGHMPAPIPRDPNYVDPMAPGVGAAVATAGTEAAAKGSSALRDWWTGRNAVPTPQVAPTDIPEVGMPQGSGASNWNKAMTGVSAPGSQMGKASMEANNKLASIVQPGGPMAGGSITEGGIALPPNVKAEKAAQVAAKAPVARMRAALGRAPAAVNKLAKPASIGSAVYNAQDLMNQYNAGNTGQAALSGLGTLGGLISLSRNPIAKAIGYGLSFGAPAVNRAIDYFNAPEPEKKADGGLVNYGRRIDNTPKGSGWLGEIRMPNGRDVMTEMSVGAPGTNETFRPAIVPGALPVDLNYIRMTGKVPEDVLATSLQHAKRMIDQGRSPFK